MLGPLLALFARIYGGIIVLQSGGCLPHVNLNYVYSVVKLSGNMRV